MTKEELQHYPFNWINDEAALTRIGQLLCTHCGCMRQQWTGEWDCPAHGDPFDTWCRKQGDAFSMLKELVEHDQAISAILGNRP